MTSPPTNAEIVAVIGAASNYAAGSVFIIRDTTWAGDSAFVMSNGTAWQVNNAIFTPAL
jgi:hypothetical protein